MVDLRGQQFGNYHLQGLLGQGGFADVYLGEHIHLHTPAAIKILQTRIGQAEMQAFQQEARTIANLEHPNIIRVMDFGVQDTVPFIVMYYAASGSLRQRHPRGTQLPLDQVVSYVRQVSDALQYAHSQRIIHRDIKPENMLLGGHQEILLSDFGIAQTSQSSQSQRTGTIVGTTMYMAPEQLQGKASRASDQYSLAITAYEWLCGSAPFLGNFMELYSQHLNVAPPSLREKRSDIVPDIDTILQKALAKDPRQRFNTIMEFAQALEQATTATQRQSGNSTTWLRTPSEPQVAGDASNVNAVLTVPDQSSVNDSAKNDAVTSGSYPDIANTPAQSVSYPSVAAAQVEKSAPLSRSSLSGVNFSMSSAETPVQPYAPPPQNWSPSGGPQKAPNRLFRYLAMIIAMLIIIALVVNIVPHIIPGTGNQGANNQRGNTAASTKNGDGQTTTGNTSDQTTVVATAPSNQPTATPIAQAAPGTTIYQADWTQGTDGWNLPPQWKAIGGGTLGSDGTADGSANNAFLVWAPAQVTGSNYSVEANIQFVRSTDTKANGSDEFGIILRGDGNNNGYEAGVQDMVSSPQYVFESSFLQGTNTLMANVQNDNTEATYESVYGFATTQQVLQHQAYQGDTQAHTFRAVIFGNTIKLYIDGTLQVSTTDNTYTSGRVGLRAVSSDVNVKSFKVVACSVTGDGC